MVRGAVLVVIALAGTAAADSPSDLVDVAQVIPDAVIDLRYATEDNFTGAVLYTASAAAAPPACKLRRAVAARLARAAKLLRAHQRRLLIWDCYRPTSVQAVLWQRVPDPRYVADPKVGSRHSRGAAIDVAVVDEAGAAVTLPTAFDDFSQAAHRDHALVGAKGAEARRLAAAMRAAGFVGLPTEWWHFDAPGRYSLADDPL